MAKPSPDSATRPRLLVLELWGLGDLALAMPFLRAAVARVDVTLVAKLYAAPLLRRLAPKVEHVPFAAPWTAFTGKYRLHRWPWRDLIGLRRALRLRDFDLGVSARLDPRDHVLLALAGARRRLGFPRTGSRFFLTDQVGRPAKMHRAEHWRALAARLGWEIEPMSVRPPTSNEASIGTPSGGVAPADRPPRILIHTGAARAVREWPRERFDAIATRLRARGYAVEVIDDAVTDIDRLLDVLARADRFIGNDSGPGHVAALLGIPTFTIFGPQLPALFAPQHPQAAWIDGAPCEYKPCFDHCRFAQPNCLLAHDVEAVEARIAAWLAGAR